MLYLVSGSGFPETSKKNILRRDGLVSAVLGELGSPNPMLSHASVTAAGTWMIAQGSPYSQGGEWQQPI